MVTKNTNAESLQATRDGEVKITWGGQVRGKPLHVSAYERQQNQVQERANTNASKRQQAGTQGQGNQTGHRRASGSLRGCANHRRRYAAAAATIRARRVHAVGGQANHAGRESVHVLRGRPLWLQPAPQVGEDGSYQLRRATSRLG